MLGWTNTHHSTGGSQQTLDCLFLVYLLSIRQVDLASVFGAEMKVSDIGCLVQWFLDVVALMLFSHKY